MGRHACPRTGGLGDYLGIPMSREIILGLLLSVIAVGLARTADAASCIQTTIVSPSPFMGTNNEIFKTDDGRLWEVKHAYEYLYEYYPTVDICGESKLLIRGKALNIALVSNSTSKRAAPSSQTRYPVTVIFRRSGCRDYFLADGDAGGVYLLEWYGGYDPSVGDAIVGKINSYGFKDVFYPLKNQSGRVWVDDYMLSKSRAMEKILEKCN
jgi:hypothetical protein